MAFYPKKTEKLWLWKASWTGVNGHTQLLGVVTGKRDKSSADKLVQQLKERYPDAVFATDDFPAYACVLNEQEHLIGKDLTYSLEQHNSDSRHYAARLKRKSKVITKRKDRVEKSLWMTEWLTKHQGLETLVAQILSI